MFVNFDKFSSHTFSGSLLWKWGSLGSYRLSIQPKPPSLKQALTSFDVTSRNVTQSRQNKDKKFEQLACSDFVGSWNYQVWHFMTSHKAYQGFLQSRGRWFISSFFPAVLQTLKSGELQHFYEKVAELKNIKTIHA